MGIDKLTLCGAPLAANRGQSWGQTRLHPNSLPWSLHILTSPLVCLGPHPGNLGLMACIRYSLPLHPPITLLQDRYPPELVLSHRILIIRSGTEVVRIRLGREEIFFNHLSLIISGHLDEGGWK